MAGTATYKRVMCQVDSVKFYPIEARYSLSRSANQVGRRIGDSLQGRAFMCGPTPCGRGGSCWTPTKPGTCGA